MSEALQFLEIKRYLDRMKGWQDVSKDQLPGMIYLSSSSRIKPDRIFAAGALGEAKDDVLAGGLYGISGKISKDEHLAQLKDYCVVVYMLEHLAHAHHHGKINLAEDVSPLIPVIGDCESLESDCGSKTAKIQMGRINLLVKKAEAQGYNITTDQKTGLYIWNFNGAQFWLIPLVYSIDSRKCYAVWKEVGDIKSSELSEFLRQNPHIRTNKTLKAHLENVARHATDEAESDLVFVRNEACSIFCADSRKPLGDGGSIDLIGGFGTPEEYARLVNAKKPPYILNQLHTRCGYVSTAVKIHDLFHAVRKAQLTDLSSEALAVWKAVDRVLREGTAEPFSNPKSFASSMGLLEAEANLFVTLFGGEENHGHNCENHNTVLSLQRILRHMSAKGVITGNIWNGFEMPAASHIDDMLAATGFMQLDPNWRVYLITEQLVRMAARSVYVEMLCNPQHNKEIDFVIFNLANGGWYFVPSYEDVNPQDINSNLRPMLVGISDAGALQYEDRPVAL